MNTDKIRERLRNGFKPFVIEVSSGSRYLVPHPEFIIVGKTVVVVMSEGESVATIDPLHIVAVENVRASRRRKR